MSKISKDRLNKDKKDKKDIYRTYYYNWCKKTGRWLGYNTTGNTYVECDECWEMNCEEEENNIYFKRSKI